MNGDELLPTRVVIESENATHVLRTALGLTIYFDDPKPWASGGASATLQSFLQIVGSGKLRYIRTSRETFWQRVDARDDVVRTLDNNVLPGTVRNLFAVWLADSPHAPETSFTYRESGGRPDEPPGYLQVTLPRDRSRDLLALARGVAQSLPFLCGTGGLVFTWHAGFALTAFERIHALSRRYIGVDVHHPERFAWAARRGLPGIGWLTMIGNDAAYAERIGELLARPHAERIARALPLAQGWLVSASAAPEVGDCNLLQFPVGLRHAACALGSLLVDPAPSLPGPFGSPDVTSRFLRRLTDPLAWCA